MPKQTTLAAENWPKRIVVEIAYKKDICATANFIFIFFFFENSLNTSDKP